MPKKKAARSLDLQYPKMKPGDVVLEMARSGRGSCKVCIKPIAMKALRVGAVFNSSMGSGGLGFAWHHLDCFPFQRRAKTITCLEDIFGYKKMKDDVKVAVETKVTASGVLIRNASAPPTTARWKEHTDSEEATWDYAQTGTMKCKDCNKVIRKSTLKIHLPLRPIALIGDGPRTIKIHGLEPGWRHTECFMKNGQLETDQLAEMILQDETVEEEDKVKVREWRYVH